VWPNPARIATYGYQIAVYTGLIILFLFVAFRASSEESVIACIAIPYTALLLTFWCFRLYPSPAGQPTTSGRLLLAPAALSGLAALALLAVLVMEWPEMKVLALVLGFAGVAAVGLLDRSREYLMQRFNHHASEAGAAGPNGREPKLGPLGYRACYGLSVLLLLLLLGVLTPLALFHASLNVERRLQIKRAQLHLASTLEQHQMRVEDQHEHHLRFKEAYGEFFRDGAARSKIGLVPLFTPDGKPILEAHKKDEPVRELYSSWFRRLVYKLHHDYNDAAAEMLGVIADRADSNQRAQSPDWTWRDDEASIQLRWHGAHPPHPEPPQPPANEEDLVILSQVPAFSSRDTWIVAAIAAAVIFVIGGLFWVLARKLFLFHIAPLKMTEQRHLAESLREGRNVLILEPPVSNWKLEEPKYPLDVKRLATGPAWAEQLDLDTVPADTLIEIRGFEYKTGDPEIDNQKHHLLQRLIQRDHTQVAAVMTVNASPEDYRRKYPELEVIDLREEPFLWLRECEGPACHLIWKECSPLPALWPIGAQLARDIRTEAVHSEDTIASEILERADAYYRLVWNECSKTQQFVLTQLAEDGLLNPSNGRAVSQLMRRGLITKDPEFRIMNESFRRFLRSAAVPELRREWRHEAHGSGWGRAHGAFVTTMIIVGVFLLTTQNELWQSSAAYVTTALGALGTLSKLAGTLKGGGPAEKAS
jgi:hypothetical protein